VSASQVAVGLKVFGHLMAEVISKRICCKCGLCVSSCPVNAISMTEEGPKLVSPCKACGACYYGCPRSQSFLAEALETSLDSDKRDDVLGRYIKIVSARTKLDKVVTRAQDGGVVTTLLMYAMEKKLIDGAVVASKSPIDPWKPVPRLALTAEEVLEAAGTKYSNCPNLLALGDAVYCYELNKVGVVGVPCQVAAARNVKVQPYAATKLGTKIAFIIGLFCMESFVHNKLLEYLSSHKIDVSRVSKFDIKEGRFKVYVDGSEALSVPIKDMRGCVNEYCHVCGDLTALYADVSVGAIGSQRGWSTVIVRSSVGDKLFEGAVKEGYLEVTDVGSGVETLKKIAARRALKK